MNGSTQYANHFQIDPVIARVDDVVPQAGRDEYGVVLGNASRLGVVTLAIFEKGLALFYVYKVVGVWVPGVADGFGRLHVVSHDLHIRTGFKHDRTWSHIVFGSFMNIGFPETLRRLEIGHRAWWRHFRHLAALTAAYHDGGDNHNDDDNEDDNPDSPYPAIIVSVPVRHLVPVLFHSGQNEKKDVATGEFYMGAYAYGSRDYK